MYLISACLVGVNCRYNGSNTLEEKLVELVEEGNAIAICPEILGNLPIPREPCEITKSEEGDITVVGESGEDYTTQFITGANKTLEICRVAEIKNAILQSRSPSCGYGKIYDGRFSGDMIVGNGITAELLSKNGITVFNEDNWKMLEEEKHRRKK